MTRWRRAWCGRELTLDATRAPAGRANVADDAKGPYRPRHMAPPGADAETGPVSAARRLTRALRGRRALVMADQVVSSGSNFLVTIIVAGMVGRSAFGAFSVALVAYQLAMGGVRAVLGEPFLSAHSADGVAVRRRASADLLRAAFVTSLVASLVMAVAAVVISGQVTAPLLAMACVFPFLGMQDSLRYVAVVDRPGLALASDLSWLTAVVALLAVAPAGASAAWFVVAWGMGGVVALGVALATMGVPLTGNGRRWLREHREMAAPFLAEVASARSMTYVVMLLLVPLAGLPAMGAVRAAQVYYGPLNTLFSGVYLVLVPDGAREKDNPRRLVRFMAVASLAVAGAAAAWMATGLLLPDRIGNAMFGRTWHNAQELMLPMGLAVVAGSASTGAFAGLRSLGDARASLRARLCSLPTEAVLSLIGLVVGGAVGYAFGYATATVLIAMTWWSFFLAAVRRHRVRLASDAGPGAGPGAGDAGGPADGAPSWPPPDPPLPQPIPGSAR